MLDQKSEHIQRYPAEDLEEKIRPIVRAEMPGQAPALSLVEDLKDKQKSPEEKHGNIRDVEVLDDPAIPLCSAEMQSQQPQDKDFLISYWEDALLKKDPKLVEPLLHQEAFLSYKDKNQNPILHQAIQKRCTETVKLLIEKGVDLSLTGSEKRTALHFIGTTRKGILDDKTIKRWIKKDPDPNARDLSGQTPLHLALCRNHTQMARLLVASKRVKIDQIGFLKEGGNSALYCAIAKNRIEAISAILNREDVQTEIRRDYKALLELALDNLTEKASVNLLRRFLPHGASIFGYLAMIVNKSPLSIEKHMKYLLQTEEYPTVWEKWCDKESGETPFHLAATHKNEDLMRCLLNHLSSRDVDILRKPDEKDMTVEHYLQTKGSLCLKVQELRKNRDAPAPLQKTKRKRKEKRQEGQMKENPERFVKPRIDNIPSSSPVALTPLEQAALFAFQTLPQELQLSDEQMRAIFSSLSAPPPLSITPVAQPAIPAIPAGQFAQPAIPSIPAGQSFFGENARQQDRSAMPQDPQRADSNQTSGARLE